MRQQLATTAERLVLVLPTQGELEAIYRRQVARLETLLTNEKQMVAANALFRQMLGGVWSDPDAQDETASGAARRTCADPL